jgi:8-oxo-dGTP pyrophosphatase MutT (NUDIX family)
MSGKSFRFTIEQWSVVRENKEYQTPIFNLLKRSMHLEALDEQQSGDFYVLEAPEWINVIPITRDDEVVLVEQFRYGIEEPTLEIPGGMVDEDEDAQVAAQRELQEETGYVAENWQSLGKVSANPAIMSNFTHIYLAKNCRFKGEIESPETDERINVHLLPIEKFLDRVTDGTIHHSIVVAAVARYLLRSRK